MIQVYDGDGEQAGKPKPKKKPRFPLIDLTQIPFEAIAPESNGYKVRVWAKNQADAKGMADIIQYAGAKPMWCRFVAKGEVQTCTFEGELKSIALTSYDNGSNTLLWSIDLFFSNPVELWWS